MEGFEEKVRAYCEKHSLFTRGDRIVTGVSGGADSVALLLTLCALRQEYGLTLEAVHVHHGIRPDAGEDADYVRELCANQDVPFTLVEKDVPGVAHKWKISEEEAGRRVRYEALEEALAQKKGGSAAFKGHEWIAVAHHAKDQAETVLHNLFRGAGLAGLGGMRPVNGNIIRPFLEVSRTEIEDYLRQRGIGYRTDSTNLSDTYTRNKIRHHVLDYAAEEINAQTVAHISQAAALLQETEDFIREQAQAALEMCRISVRTRTAPKPEEKIEISILKLSEIDPFLQKQVILLCIEQIAPHTKDITAVHIRQIRDLCKRRESGERQLQLPAGIRVCRQYERLIFYRYSADSPEKKKAEKVLDIAPFCIQLPILAEGDGLYTIELPGLGVLDFQVIPAQDLEEIPQKTYTKWFDYDRIEQSLQVRTRRTGDFLCINEALGRKSLKDYMIQEKIPKSERDGIYLLSDASHIVWVVGYRISEAYKVGPHTKRILVAALRRRK